MATKRCYRTLDRPIEIFGLEPEDLTMIITTCGILLFLWDALPAILLGIGSWIFLRRMKGGKPAGYLYYLLYRSRVLRYTPPFLRTPFLIRPPALGTGFILKLSAIGEVERAARDSFIRYWWLDKQRLL